MKKLILSIVTLGVSCALLLNACKKKDETTTTPTPTTPSYTCTNCITAPEAKAANDTVSKGIYKGIVVGSSGTIKFDIMNSDNTIKAYLTIDGATATLTASVNWVAGVSYVSSFTGTLSGQAVSIDFKVDANGGNPLVTAMNIPGHPNAALTLSKETSANLIKCFEGSATNATTGKKATFDLFLSTSLKKWTAKVKEEGSTSISEVSGTFDGTTLSFNDGKGASGSAKLTGDEITDGKWSNSKPENGTWTAKRTL
jgi:hypothetical protein